MNDNVNVASSALIPARTTSGNFGRTKSTTPKAVTLLFYGLKFYIAMDAFRIRRFV